MKKSVCLRIVLAILCISGCRENPKTASAETREIPSEEMTAEDYFHLGLKKLYTDWEYNVARESLLRAVELNPGDARSHAHLAWYWILHDDKEKSMTSIEQAKRVDPENSLWVLWHGWICYLYNDLDCADHYLKESIAMMPDQRNAYFILGEMNYLNGKTQEAIKWMDRAAQDSTGQIAKAVSQMFRGRNHEARKSMDSIISDDLGTFVLVPLYEMLGKRDSSFYLLEKYYQERHPSLPWLRYIPNQRPLHEDPRFWELVEKVENPMQDRKTE